MVLLLTYASMKDLLPELLLQTHTEVHTRAVLSSYYWIGAGLDVMFCAIWHHLFNLKNVKNTHGGVLLLVKLQGFSKSNTPPWVFFTF